MRKAKYLRQRPFCICLEINKYTIGKQSLRKLALQTQSPSSPLRNLCCNQLFNYLGRIKVVESGELLFTVIAVSHRKVAFGFVLISVHSF